MTLFAFSIPMALYHIYGWMVPIVILAALFGLRWKVGMWGNLLSVGAVLLSFLIAVGWWEYLAYFLAKQAPMTLFVADCVAFFTIFVIALSILDLATRQMSTVKVKYAEMVENIGNGVALFLLFLAVYGVFLFGSEDLGAVGERPGVSHRGNSVAITALRVLSAGNLSGFTQVNQFDGGGDFRALHLQRRQALMHNMVQHNQGEDKKPIQGLQGTDAQVEKIKWRE